MIGFVDFTLDDKPCLTNAGWFQALYQDTSFLDPNGMFYNFENVYPAI